MTALGAALAALWLAVLIARPTRPRIGNETAFLVYARLDNAWGRLVLAATLLTLGTVLMLLTLTIRAANDDLMLMRHPCVAEYHQAPGQISERCWQLNDHNQWVLTGG